MEFSGSSNRKLFRKLRCEVKNYDWGLLGSESTVARLHSMNSDASIVEDKPYAELWMGTHDSGPSVLIGVEDEEKIGAFNDGNENLKLWLAKNPNVLGDKVSQRWGNDLPFLFKVLSVAKALSIQAHPDKELAGMLHKEHPNLYKDANHKPEMALALTEFEALCGFVGMEELKEVLQSVPEIVEVVGSAAHEQTVLDISDEEDSEKVKAALRLVFTQLMSANTAVISQAVFNMMSRLNLESKERQLTEKENLVLELERQYPADVGVIAAFLFNHVKLKPGEALYLGANEPHAYLSGECIECMATSDNVVRAGLTPKLRDVQTLCSMLTYKQGFPDILEGVEVDPYTRKYLPPFEEFEVDRCILPEGVSYNLRAVQGPSILLITKGEGKSFEDDDVVSEGDVLFVPADTEIGITVGNTSQLHLYRAGVNSSFFGAY
ncbi:mannose-6-phosphate isomerase 1-like [Impatiens glandulifera]|uniref:mannose-6-phosphate isomerase 1-like n=1 Tax=Impatiens glandulifera TaxID=253017 RepID=UPI001FB14EB1|nr:mannose-6-phosphate isomerase 1-like [Impatiens glandulifera]